MHLQAEPRARLDEDALDLEARAMVEVLVPAPRPMDATVRARLAAAGLGERRHEVLDVGTLRAVGDEHRVRGLDHGDVVEADDADEAAGRVDERVARVADDGVALDGVASTVAGADLPDRVPGAEIAPAGGERDHRDLDSRAGPAR